MSTGHTDFASYTVEFIDVGRGKARWTEQLDQFPTEAILVRLVHKRRVLASRGIDCDTDGDAGVVLVGGWRPVGRYEIRGVPA